MVTLKYVILQLNSTITSTGGPYLCSLVLTLALVTNIGEGNFFAEDLDEVTSGLSILHVRPSNSINADVLHAQDHMYSLLVTSTGVAQTSTVQLLVTNKEIEIPTNPFIFAAIIEGYYLLLMAVAG
jgi:hypothetical protein